jgi:transcriptional regulator with XRE-family HTH domain
MVRAAEPVGGEDRTPIAPAVGGPTVLRILLGAQLRRLREAKRITLEDAGRVIRASHSKISRLETGRVGFKDRDITDLLTFYGVTDEEEREALRSLARRANAPGWWHDYSDVLPSWFEAYVGLEEVATQVRAYEVQFVPGLLQCEDYARAVTLLGHDDELPREIERRVRLRMARQMVLAKQEPPNVWAVVDEAVLRRPAGKPGRYEKPAEAPDRGGTAAERDHSGHAVPGRWSFRGRRPVQHPAVRRARPARRGIPRTAHQRAVPGQTRGRGQLPEGDGARLHGGRDAGRQHRCDRGDPRRNMNQSGGNPGTRALNGPVTPSRGR